MAWTKKRFRGRPVRQKCTELVARRGVRVEVNLPPGGRRFGRKEERKNGRFKCLKMGLHALTRRVGGFIVRVLMVLKQSSFVCSLTKRSFKRFLLSVKGSAL